MYPYTTRINVSRWLILMVCLLLTLTGCGVPDGPSAAAVQHPQAQVSSPTITVTPERPIPTLSALDATKQADQDNLEHERATAAARPTPATWEPLPTAGTSIPAATGIDNNDCDSLYLRLYDPFNCWRGPFDNQWLFLVAGAKPGQSNQGLVGLYRADLTTGETSDWFEYLTPSAMGKLKITQVALPLFTLVSTNGTTYVFNVATRAWETPSVTVTSTPQTPSPTSPSPTPPQTPSPTSLANPSPTPPQTASGSVTFTALADARVEQQNPTTNYGTSGNLRVEASDPGENAAIESYVSFTVAGLRGPVQQVKLRMYATTNGTNVGSTVYNVNTPWTETGITWNTRPTRGSAPLATAGGVGTNTWVDYDLTALVTGNGSFSVALVALSDDGVSFSSRQGTTPPILVVTAAAASLPNPRTFGADADARVESANATMNYGTSTTLEVDSSPALESYLRFTVTNIVGTVQNAKLRLYVGSNGTDNGPAVYTTDPNWTETGITWNARPSRGNTIVANTAAIGTNVWVEYNVTAVVTGNGTYSFALVGESADAVTFVSRQGDNPPQLVLALTGAP